MALGLGQAEMAARLNEKPSVWNHYEQGKRQIPPLTVGRWKAKDGITFEWIYEGDRRACPTSSASS